MQDLALDIGFSLRKSGDDRLFTRADDPCVCGYQITASGLYVIGNMGCHASTPDIGTRKSGFTPYPFDYDPEIIAKIAAQWLQKQPHRNTEYDDADGGHDKGYLMQDVWGLEYEMRETIDDVWSAIICLVPYRNYYAK